MKRTKKLLSLALALGLCAGLLPVTAAARDRLPELPDVFQGNGLYVTMKDLDFPEGWSLTVGGIDDSFMAYQGVCEGLIPVVRRVQVIGDDGYPAGFRREINYVNTDGQLMFDFSDWETPPSCPISPSSSSPIYNFRDGVACYYDDVVKKWGYMDKNGEKVTEAIYSHSSIFKDGIALVTEETKTNGRDDYERYYIDTTGKRLDGLFGGRTVGKYGDGLISCSDYLDYDNDKYFVGWLDTEGNRAITLYYGSWEGYSKDEYLSLPTMSAYRDYEFVDGYAIAEDWRNGRRYPAYHVFNTKGEVVRIIDAEAPVYVQIVSGTNHSGTVLVRYKDTMNSGNDYSALLDYKGNTLMKTTALFSWDKHIEGGVVAYYGFPDVDEHGVLADYDGNAIIPKLTTIVPEDIHYTARDLLNFSGLAGDIHEDKAILRLNYSPADGTGGPPLYFLLEIHQGVYTGPGRVYNAATGQIKDNGNAPVQPEQPAGDAPSSWAVTYVDQAKKAGIVPADLQSKYTQNTTRAEYCALATALYESIKGEITERQTFTDTTDVNVEKMAALGVVNGVGDNKFSPDAHLTREQAAVMLSRLAEALGKPFPEQAPTFADNSSISDWAVSDVGRAQASGIMGGVGNNTFSPLTGYTREQSITTMVRMMEHIK